MITADVLMQSINPDRNITTTVLNASVELNHENWPLFHHFVRLLTDPFVYIHHVELSPQQVVLNVLAGAINQIRGRLQCDEFTFNLEGNVEKFIGWIKEHVLCKKIQIDYRYSFHNKEMRYSNDVLIATTKSSKQFLDLLVTGARCTSVIKIEHYDLYNVVVDFIQKFIDLKSCDENQMIESVRGNISSRSVEGIKRTYAKFIVKEERNKDNRSAEQVFEFVNKDMGKKLTTKIYLRFPLYYNHALPFSLTIKNL
ncbi:hypothetical protein Ddc_18956 [Ditylenchus destructor]|nr:hypothetical protein Ddc_18956 [Ditylenchus destructor]